MVNSLTVHSGQGGANKLVRTHAKQGNLMPAAVPPADPRDTLSAHSSSPLPLIQEKKSFGNFVSRIWNGNRWATLEQIKELEELTSRLKTPQDFIRQTEGFKARLKAGESLEDIRTEAYAVASKACQAALGVKPYDSQLLGALALGSGEIAEMMTGEGKSLTAVLPLYLHALAGKGAQLVTVNDTLAQRDAAEMKPAFQLLGLSVGTVLENMKPEEKRDGYAADVTYTTDRTLGFDYLRDKTVKDLKERVQRPPFFALIDEVDEVLLDEARTPLIISAKGAAPTEDYQTLDGIVEELKPGIDYFVDREQGSAWLSDHGLEYVENELFGHSVSRKDPDLLSEYHRKAGALLAEGKAYRSLLEHQRNDPGLISGLFNDSWKEKKIELQTAHDDAAAKTDSFPDRFQLHTDEHQHLVPFLHASLKAHALFKEGVDYIVQDDRVKIVDENKGRTSKGRRFNQGLHQALEAKSGVPIRPESKPIASITYPNLFKHYPHLAGMSGTAKSSEAEFQKLYNLDVSTVPTNLQFQTSPDSPESALRHNRIDQPDSIFATKREKFAAVADEAIKAFEEGVPVLLGTLSVEANEYLHALLVQRGVNPAAIQVLNAEHVRGDKSLENSIISQAGRSGMITVATNMAGRGVNIKPDMVNYKKLTLAIEELAAQGKPIIVDVNGDKEAENLSQWLEGRFSYRVGEGQPKPGETLIRISPEDDAQNDASRLKTADFPTGGLYVIGTERANSRRIDDQLIGRSARQGQPGRSQFFLSLEDDLVRELAKHKLNDGLEMLSGTQGDFVNELVAKAQGKLAEMDLYGREQSGLYDKVLNDQREAFYEIRESALSPQARLLEKLTLDTRDFVTQKLTEQLADQEKPTSLDIRNAFTELSKTLKTPIVWKASNGAKSEHAIESAVDQVERALERSIQQFEKAGVDLGQIYRHNLLSTSDNVWSEHLNAMHSLKQGIHLVTTVGEKPEDAYTRRGFEVFENTLEIIRDASVKENVPQIIVGAAIIKRDRELAQSA